MDYPTSLVIITIIVSILAIVIKLLPTKRILRSEVANVNFDAKIASFEERFRGIDEKIDNLKETLNSQYNFLLQEIRSLRK